MRRGLRGCGGGVRTTESEGGVAGGDLPLDLTIACCDTQEEAKCHSHINQQEDRWDLFFLTRLKAHDSPWSSP